MTERSLGPSGKIALLISTSILEYCFIVFLTISLIDCFFVMSTFIARGFTSNFFLKSDSSFLHSEKFKSARTILAPALLNNSEYLLPNNPDAPTKITTCPERSNKLFRFTVKQCL